MRIIFGIFLAMLMTNFVMAAVPTEKVELIFQKKFSNQLEDVILTPLLTTETKAKEMGYINIQKSNDNKVQILNPQVIITNNSYIFNDKNLKQNEINLKP